MLVIPDNKDGVLVGNCHKKGDKSMGVEDVNDAAKHQRQIQALRGSKSQSKKKQELPDGPSQEKQGDNVTISPAAKEKIKIARYAEIVNKMPDVREDVIARVKNNLEKGAYSDPEIYRKTAERMLHE